MSLGPRTGLRWFARLIEFLHDSRRTAIVIIITTQLIHHELITSSHHFVRDYDVSVDSRHDHKPSFEPSFKKKKEEDILTEVNAALIHQGSSS
jgi:hypothetical protein